MNELISVAATIVDEQGGGDGAYDLIMDSVSPEEFCAELLKTLKSDWGLSNAKGAVTLNLHITKG